MIPEPINVPRPWIVEENDDGHLIRMGSAIGSRHSHQVQHVIQYDHGLSDPDEYATEAERAQYDEAEAIVHLAAAAPDLEDAVRGLLEIFDNALSEEQQTEHAQHLLTAQLALCKAAGHLTEVSKSKCSP